MTMRNPPPSGTANAASRGLPALRNLLEPLVEALDYELAHLELRRLEGELVLRVYIDAPGGIQVDDCVAVSRRLSIALDVDDALPSAYRLEVSSPGLDRPLAKPAHFRRFVGSRAQVVMKAGARPDGRRRFSGELAAADADAAGRATLLVDGERYELAYEDIDTARLEAVF